MYTLIQGCDWSVREKPVISASTKRETQSSLQRGVWENFEFWILCGAIYAFLGHLFSKNNFFIFVICVVL